MEIDIFPIQSTKGVHRYIGTSFLGLITFTYIVGAYKVAIGKDKELLCFLFAILIIIEEYAVLIFLVKKYRKRDYPQDAPQHRGKYTIEIDENIIEHLPQLEGK